MRNVRLSISLILIVLSSSFSVFSQEDSGKCDVNLNIGSDIMSRYVWRGTDYGNSPSIQPTLSVTVKNFEIGYWGAIATNSFYKEIDLYAKYTVKNFSLILTDYYIPYANGIDASPDNRYFIFDDKKLLILLKQHSSLKEMKISHYGY